MNFLVFLGFLLGALFGVALMCVLAIDRDRRKTDQLRDTLAREQSDMALREIECVKMTVFRGATPSPSAQPAYITKTLLWYPLGAQKQGE